MSNAPSIHPQALCETPHVGPRTRVWAFAHLLPGARVGADCNICDNVFIENDVVLGDRVTVKCGVQLWDGIEVEDDVFIGPNVTFTNDPFPRSRQYQAEVARTRIEQGASIGANATLLPGIRIGAHAMIGAGAVVTRSVPPHAIAVGNPARITGYVGGDDTAERSTTVGEPAAATGPVRVAGVSLHRLPVIRDMRGDLSVGEFAKDLPFAPRRYFVVYNVPSKETRGAHAHRVCGQVLIALHGSCAVVVDDGTSRQEIVLNDPSVALHIPPMVWGTQYKYTPDAVLLVLASHEYEAADYIRTYADFLREKEQQQAALKTFDFTHAAAATYRVETAPAAPVAAAEPAVRS